MDEYLHQFASNCANILRMYWKLKGEDYVYELTVKTASC